MIVIVQILITILTHSLEIVLSVNFKFSYIMTIFVYVFTRYTQQ